MTETDRKHIVAGLLTGCRVCLGNRIQPFVHVEQRDYWRCTDCAATFLDDAQLPDRETEHKQYQLHNNDPHDLRYRCFLNKLFEPLHSRLQPGARGLDFGCGPGPALALMLTEAGCHMSLYDPFFQPDTSVLNAKYDLIVCAEVVEHFHQPAIEFAQLDAMLEPGGWLGIMTCFQTDDLRFANWHYRRDPTHVVFYREETFHHIARRFGWNCEIPAKDVVLMYKSDPAAPPNGRHV